MFVIEKVVEMIDDQLNLMMEMDVVYLIVFSNDKEVKKLRIMMLMKIKFLQYHDDVLMKMVQQILVYNLFNELSICKKKKKEKNSI
jgi:hypothetical protein